MKVIEQFIQSKSGKEESCEDRIFVNEYFIAMVDGATRKSDKTWGN